MRRSPQTALVMAEFLREKAEWRYGYDVSRATGLASGTLYPILIRLAERGMMETMWETAPAGRPPRHMYRLNQNGVRYAREIREILETTETTVAIPVWSGVRG